VRRVARRFNPPPGWPPAPPNWLPGPDWPPDPAWPTPPPGWPLVIEENLRDKLTRSDVHPWRLLAAGTLLAAACFAAYWSWLGWDHTYQTDPTTGITSGPYEPWQVAGCALTLAAIALTGGLAKQAWTTLVVMPLAFTVAWSIPASTSDGDGLWTVGAILIFGGMVLGALAVALPATYLREHLQRRNRP